MEGLSWEGLHWIGEIGFRHLWQSLLIVGLISILLLRKNTWSAEHRSWIWAGGIFAMAALPLLTLIPLPELSLAGAAGQRAAEQATIGQLLQNAYHIDAGYLMPLTAPMTSGLFDSPLWMIGLAVIWAGFSLWALGRLTLACLKTHDLITTMRQASPDADFLPAEWPRRVSVAFHDDITGPMTIGLVKPIVLLPSHLPRTLAPLQVHHVLAHELAHIERGDLRIAFIQRVLLAAFWWNPLMHYACRQLRLERELACDDRAVRKTGCSRNYATSLLDSAEALITGEAATTRLVAVGAFEHPGEKSFTMRIRRLIGQNYAAQMRFGLAHGAGLVAIMLVAVSLFVLTPRSAFSQTIAHEVAQCCDDLILAISAGDSTKIKQQLTKPHFDATCSSDVYGTPLIASAKADNVKLIKHLVKKGAPIDTVHPKKGTALMAAIGSGHKESMKKLIALGADVNVGTNNKSPLILAAYRGDYYAVKYLVSKGADTGQVAWDQHGNPITAISVAKQKGHEKIVKYLSRVKPHPSG